MLHYITTQKQSKGFSQSFGFIWIIGFFIAFFRKLLNKRYFYVTIKERSEADDLSGKEGLGFGISRKNRYH